MSTTAAAPKALRSDARRNRERLVASARELFSRSGPDVPVEDITQHAGLGMGTLYRHFPTKDELIDAVLEDTFAELVDAATEAAAAQDTWLGFTGFLERVFSLHAANRGLKDVLAARGQGSERAEAMRARIKPLLRAMIERAQAEGALRPDFSPEDLPVVFWSGERVIHATATVAPDYWRRYLALLLDGLRAETATPLPGRPLTQAQLRQASARRHG